jgi:hypothetical protein
VFQGRAVGARGVVDVSDVPFHEGGCHGTKPKQENSQGKGTGEPSQEGAYHQTKRSP